MPINKNIRCETTRCIEDIAKHGEQYHMVYDLKALIPLFMPDAIVRCEHCGGYSNGKEWKHGCSRCSKTVDKGKLVGFFVPHLCAECLGIIIEEEIKNGDICRICHNPSSLCCC